MTQEESTPVPLPAPTSDDLKHFEDYKTDSSVRVRVLIERAIVRSAARALIDAGYSVAIHNGEEQACRPTRELAEVMAAIMTTDEDAMLVYPAAASGSAQEHPQTGWVSFVYGNSGWDVIHDYTTNLETALEPADRYSDQLAYWC